MAGILLLLLTCACAPPPQEPALRLPQPPGGDTASLREKLHNSADPKEQTRAALLLIQSTSPETVALVKFELKSPRADRPEVFQALAGAIRMCRDVRYLDAMLDALGAEQVVIREEAAQTLAALPAVAVHDPLLKLAEDPKRLDFTRQAAAEALGKVASRQCVLSLIKLLRSDSASVRKAATQGLESITGQEYGVDGNQWTQWWQSYYQDMTEADWQADRMRYFEAKARRLQADLDQADKTVLQLNKELLNRVSAPELVKYLQDLAANPYPAVRRLAVDKIAEQLARKDLDPTGRKSLTDVLLNKLSGDLNQDVKQRAVLTLEKADSPEVYRRLIDLLRDRNTSIRAAAARSLGNYRGHLQPPDTVERTLAALELAIHDSPPGVIANVATSIGALGLPRSGDILAQLLTHPDPQVRNASSAALESIASCRVFHPILAAFDRASPEGRLYLVGCLGRIGENDGLPEREQLALVAKLQHVLAHDGDPGVRSKAAAALGKVGGPSELALLWQRVRGNEDARVLNNAWMAMVEILARTRSWPIADQWQQQLAIQSQPDRRLELLKTLRESWKDHEEGRATLDLLNAALIEAALVQRQWKVALPVCLDMIRAAVKEKDKSDRLNLLLQICKQAVDEGKGRDVLSTIQEVEGALRGFPDLAIGFDQLRRRIEPSPPATGGTK
jgi:HEAT repeat protein